MVHPSVQQRNHENGGGTAGVGVYSFSGGICSVEAVEAVEAVRGNNSTHAAVLHFPRAKDVD